MSNIYKKCQCMFLGHWYPEIHNYDTTDQAVSKTVI